MSDCSTESEFCANPYCVTKYPSICSSMPASLPCAACPLTAKSNGLKLVPSVVSDTSHKSKESSFMNFDFMIGFMLVFFIVISLILFYKLVHNCLINKKYTEIQSKESKNDSNNNEKEQLLLNF